MAPWWKEKTGNTRILLKGKINYTQWVPACKMELRGEDVLQMIADPVIKDPESLSQGEQDALVIKWLSEQEEIPENGWSTQKIKSNRLKWLKEQKDVYKVWSTANNKALAIIYNLCEKHPASLIKNEKTAKGAWACLADAYKQEGFAAIYEQVSKINSINYRSCNSLEEYVNKIKSIRIDLESHNHEYPEDFWCATLINGLGETFELFTAQILGSPAGKHSLEDLI